jgi:hypothetical protein
MFKNSSSVKDGLLSYFYFMTLAVNCAAAAAEIVDSAGSEHGNRQPGKDSG